MRLMIAIAAVSFPAATFAQAVGPSATPPPRPTTTSSPETSREAPINGVLVLYGNQRCPTDAAGNEVVVCRRVDANEQFRIPKTLRDGPIKPENESWAVRADGITNVGAAGIGSCSAGGGPGGMIGCANQRFIEARRENKAKKAEQAREEAAIGGN
ncbi:MAG: hypothetical protein K2Y03_10430 [Sphingomonas sp.]|nr:hypothetical protein [Sphingomonas sp.]